MPVSICSASAALHDTLTTTFSSIKSDESFNNEISGSAKQALLTKIEYEETSSFQASQESLKSKYIFIKAKCNGTVNISSINSKNNVPERENRPNISSSEYMCNYYI